MRTDRRILRESEIACHPTRTGCRSTEGENCKTSVSRAQLRNECSRFRLQYCHVENLRSKPPVQVCDSSDAHKVGSVFLGSLVGKRQTSTLDAISANAREDPHIRLRYPVPD